MHRKIYVVGGSIYDLYANWMEGLIVDRMSEASLVVFPGGVDVNPKLYGRKMHPFTEHPNQARDAREKEEFEMAKAMQLPMVGICRGAQFLCVMAGGILVQHQYHPKHHWMETCHGVKIYVTSDHHQRQYPYVPGLNKKILGWTDVGFSPYSFGEDDEDLTGELEVENCYYPDIKALCIQSHPEWQYPAKGDDWVTSLNYHRGLLNALVHGNL